MDDKQFLQRAIEKAKESISRGGFPAGAVVVKDGKVVGEGISVGNKLNDPTSHGEMAAIRDACKNLATADLSGAILYASIPARMGNPFCEINKPMIFLNFLFWAFLTSYIVHILDETLVNGGFVKWIAGNFWPTYDARMFFWFNAAFIAANAVSNILFDNFGGHWVILPLIFIAGFVTHVFTVHLYWTVRLNTYSPGLLTSTLYLIIFYLLVRYGLAGNLINVHDFVIGVTIGVLTIGSFLTVGPTVLFPTLMKNRR